MDVKVWVFSIALLAICMSCAEETDTPAVTLDDLVVAEVGDKAITVKQLREFSDNLPKRHQSIKTGLERERDHLQTMIDMEFLLMEALNERIAQSPDFLRKMETIKKRKLVGVFQQRNIKVKIKENEIQEYVEREELSRALRLGDILVDSKDKAEAVFAELKGGESFAQVAEKWSMNKDTSTRGGDMGQYLIKDQMIPILQDTLFSLAVGEVSAPIKIGNRYSIFKVIAEKIINLNPQQRTKIEQDFGIIKLGLERAALVEQLKNRYRLEVDRGGLKAFVESLRQGALFAAEDEHNIVIYRYDKGQITAGDLVDVAGDLKGDVLASLTDGKRVLSFAEKYAIPAIMIMEAALDAGIDKEEEITTWFKDQRRQLLLAELRSKALEGKINLSTEALQQHYDSHPKKYLHPEQLDIQEILVETEPEAQRLIEKIQEGVPMGELARKYTLRSVQDQGDEEGRFHFHEHESPHFGGLVEAAFEAQIGELKGPVEVKDGYSIFKVLSRERKRETFAEAEWRVRRDVKKIKSREVFNRYVEGLQNKYESHVSIREENLKTAFEMR